MKKAKPRNPRPKKTMRSSWSVDGPVSVTFEISEGSMQLMWLRFHRAGFDGLVFTDLDAVENLHHQLGLGIVAAKQELAEMAAAHAADLAKSEPHADEVPPPPAAG